MYRSSIKAIGADKDEPNYLYYNADIINNNTLDTNTTGDPTIRFNETRTTALIKDASKYLFSIVRFSMNGANRDLPLFIPGIQTGQNDVNLSIYSFGLYFEQSFVVTIPAGLLVSTTFSIAQSPNEEQFVQFAPENQNSILAPTPRDPVVSQELTSRYYWVSTYTHWLNLCNQTMKTAHQDIFQQFCDQYWSVNTTANSDFKAVVQFPFVFTVAGVAVLDTNGNAVCNFSGNWADATTVAGGILPALPVFSPADLIANAGSSFQGAGMTPSLSYNPQTRLIACFGDSDAFGDRLLPFTAGASAGSALTPPILRLFMNGNAYGLFSNFDTVYWNDSTNFMSSILQPASGNIFLPPVSPINTATQLTGYVNEIIFTNNFYQNVVDYNQAPYNLYVPSVARKTYYQLSQDYGSTDSLWSPITSIVFCSSLLPVRAEQTGPPIVLGQSNLGMSAPTSLSAFQPIITDITLDQSADGAETYRKFILYLPSAEYRLADFGLSKQEIRSIDIYVYWKCKLDNNLYPVQMYNASSVNIKIMFKKKQASEYQDNQALFE